MLYFKGLTAAAVFATSLLATTPLTVQPAIAKGGQVPTPSKKEQVNLLSSAPELNQSNPIDLDYSRLIHIVLPYKVSQGDQLSYLANQYNTSEQEIMQLNNMTQDKLIPGQTLNIPLSLKLDTHPESQAKAKPVKKKESKSSHKLEQNETAKAVEQQTRHHHFDSRQSLPVKSVMDMRATAYGNNENGQWGAVTTMGNPLHEGVIAVDPSVIPLGSKVYVTGYNHPLLPKGGFVAVAEDTGGAIKGDRIDIYINGPQKQIDDFGIQNVKVYILKK